MLVLLLTEGRDVAALCCDRLGDMRGNSQSICAKFISCITLSLSLWGVWEAWHLLLSGGGGGDHFLKQERAVCMLSSLNALPSSTSLSELHHVVSVDGVVPRLGVRGFVMAAKPPQALQLLLCH